MLVKTRTLSLRGLGASDLAALAWPVAATGVATGVGFLPFAAS